MKKENKIHLLFSKTEQKPKENEIIIFPEKDNWNDFGHRIRCHFVIGPINSKDEIYEDIIFFGFQSKKDKKIATINKDVNSLIISTEELTNLSSIFHQNKEGLFSKENIHDFFTMLPNMQSYRKFVSFYGVEIANELLLIMNDLVVKKQKSEHAEWIQNAIETSVFKLGFMRNSEPFFTYNNADSILNGLKEEKFDKISNNLKLAFKLNSFPNQHNLTLKYEHDSLIPKRINILIGKNGLGKSQALNKFCRSALRYKDEENFLIDEHSINGRPMINRLLAIGTPGETSNTFPAERINTQKLYYRRLNLTRNGRTKTSRSTIELLVQLARSEEYIGNDDRWSIFIQSLNKAFGISNIVLQLKNGSYCSLDKIHRGGGEATRLELWSNLDYKSEPFVSFEEGYYPLSSGQLTFFKFALLSSLFIENGSFVLMDEPETHLHPNLISDFINLLDFLLEKTGSFALLATHSAYLVREVSREQVHIFKVDEEKNISIVQPRLRTFGANVDMISEFVFEDNIENRLTYKIIEKVSQKSFETIDKEIGHEISLPSLMTIKRYKDKN